MSHRLPNFLHLGPSKSGSTWLHEALISHPEIYFTHARALEAANQERAGHYFDEAARVVRGKIDSLQDPAQRDSYRWRAQVSAKILDARPGGP